MGSEAEQSMGPEAESVRQRHQSKSLAAGEASHTMKSISNIIPDENVTPLSQAFVPSVRIQNFTIWILLVVSIVFTTAVVVEELQARWYRSPVLNFLADELRGLQSLDLILDPDLHTARKPRVVRLAWIITKGISAPDGVAESLYLINGHFMGPTIETRSGDVLHLDIDNRLDDEEITLHFRGLHVYRASEQGKREDGPETPTRRGRSMSYRVQIPEDWSGTFWYHAGCASQRSKGVFGALIIHRPNDLSMSTYSEFVGEERVVMINERYHVSGSRNASKEFHPPSLLINGIGAYNCSRLSPEQSVSCTSRLGSKSPNMKFEAGIWSRIRFINASAQAITSISIPSSTITVIEVDGGQRIQHKRGTSFGMLHPGQRVDVLLKWSAGGDDEIRIAWEEEDDDSHISQYDSWTSQAFPIKISGFLQAKRYAPISRHIDLQRLLPVETAPIAKDANHTIVLRSTVRESKQGDDRFPRTIYQTSTNAKSLPTLSLSQTDQDSFQLAWSVPETPLEDFWTDIVLHNQDDEDCILYSQGSTPWLMWTGVHAWDSRSWRSQQQDLQSSGTTIVQKALRRDTFWIPTGGYVVLRVKVEIGALKLRCHSPNHVGRGLSIKIVSN